MQIEWDTNWAPTIVSLLGGMGIMALRMWWQRKRISKSRPPSENIEVENLDGSTLKFRGAKTYSRRETEIKSNGSQKFSEESIQFESSEGVSRISTKQIKRILKRKTLKKKRGES